MDTFIDKLAQKTIANDMINANAAAEARENQKIAEQLAGYDELLQEMKQVNLKNIESAAKVNELLEGVELKNDVPSTAGISAEDMEELKSSLDGKADEIVRAGEDTANSVKYAAEDAVLSVKLSAEEAVKNIEGKADEKVDSVKSAVDDVVSAVKASSDDAVSTVKNSADEAVSAVKASADDAIASLKEAGETAAKAVTQSTDEIKAVAQTSADDIKDAAHSTAEDIKKAAQDGVEEMKQASSESVESMKQASVEATETIKQVVEEGLEAIKGASDGVVRGEAPQMDQTYLDAQFDDVHEAIHTENIKVYRNVQAAVDDSLADQTKAIRGYIERTQKDGSKVPLILGIVNFALNIIIIALLLLSVMGVF